MLGNKASRSFAGVVGGCIRGMGMRRVRLSMGGRVVMASSGGNPIQISKIVGSPRAEMEDQGWW